MKTSGNGKHPSEVLILRGLSAEITEKMIFEKINELGHRPQYVRIIRNKSTGISKGIAIIRFESLEESEQFLEKNSVLEISDSSTWLEYGFEHSNEDWICKSCNNINFQHREACFKCSSEKFNSVIKTGNNGSEDVSTQPTRFLLIRNLDENMDAKKIYEKVSLTDNHLKRVWVIQDCHSKISKGFAFFEFPTIQESSNFLDRQNKIGVPLKIGLNETIISFGRDLSLLTQSLNGSITGKIIYWDNTCEFSEFPTYVISVPESAIRSETSHTLGIPVKRSAFGAIPNLSHNIPSKKIQLQLKTWTVKSQESDLNSDSTTQFVAAGDSSCKTKNKFIDTTFLCCLLCDKKFGTESELLDHAQNSEQHAIKFNEYWIKTVSESKESQEYLDRAAERRYAFGVDDEEVKRLAQAQESQKSLKFNPDSIIQPAERTDTHDSIGAKLLKKMGWKEGTGLGKTSGIIEPVKAKTLEHTGAGIGASNLISADEIKSKTYNEMVNNDRTKRYKR